MKRDCRHVQKECRTCGEVGRLEALCKRKKVDVSIAKPNDERAANAGAKPAASALCVSLVWHCVECWVWQHHEGPKCRPKTCKGMRRNLQEVEATEPATAEASKKERFHTARKGNEVVGRVLQLAGGEEEAEKASAASPAVQKEYDRLTNLIAAMEEAGEVTMAAGEREKRGKLKMPAVIRLAQDRVSSTARMLELELKSEKAEKELLARQEKLLEDQSKVVLGKDRDLEEAKANYERTVQVIKAEHEIAVKVVEQRLKANAEELRASRAEFEAKAAEVQLCLKTLDGEAPRPIQPAAAVMAAPFVTTQQLSTGELESLMLTDPLLAGVGSERAALMAACFCRVLDARLLRM